MNATMVKEMAVLTKLPYLIAVFGIVSSERLVSLAARSAGVSTAGVMISSTRELMILLNSLPTTTPIARSTTLPFMANSRNSLTMDILFDLMI